MSQFDLTKNKLVKIYISWVDEDMINSIRNHYLNFLDDRCLYGSTKFNFVTPNSKSHSSPSNFFFVYHFCHFCQEWSQFYTFFLQTSIQLSNNYKVFYLLKTFQVFIVSFFFWKIPAKHYRNCVVSRPPPPLQTQMGYTRLKLFPDLRFSLGFLDLQGKTAHHVLPWKRPTQTQTTKPVWNFLNDFEGVWKLHNYCNGRFW